MGELVKQTGKELKGSKKGKVLLFGFCLALMSSASIFTAFAGTWFSKSRFAYWGGDILLWGSQEVEGLLVAGPKDSILGEDPWIQMMVNGWNCYMTEFSNVQIDFEWKDYFAVGTWEIQKGTTVYTENASDLTPFMAGMNITKVAIIAYARVKYGSVEYVWSSSSTNTTQNPGSNAPNPRADMNGDHWANILHLALIARAFGATKGSERYDSSIDLNSDFVVNIVDIAIVAKNFGRTF